MGNSASINILRQSGLFAVLDDNELRDLEKIARQRQLVAGETIFWEGDDADRFFIVAEGKIKVTKLASTGKEIILSFFGPGEIFGEVAVFEGKPYPASARSTSAARLIGFHKDEFLGFLKQHPQVALRIVALLSGRLREAQSRLRDLAGERVEQRLARMLLMLSARLGSALPFTRQELSEMSGTTTETTIRILSQWKERGFIRSTRAKIVILDEVKLHLLAEGPPQI